MKLGKVSWIIITVGIIVVAFGSLGLARHQQSLEQTQLRDELSVAGLRLKNIQIKPLESRNAELQQQLDQALTQLEMAKDELRQPIESIGVVDSVFNIARDCNVEITRITSSALGEDKLEGIPYSVIRLTIGVEGDVPDFISFVTRLNNDFGTGVTTSVQMGIRDAPEGEAPAGEEAPAEEPPDTSTGSVQIVIYSYQD